MKEKEYHKARRMFFVIDDNLIIAEANSDKSHFEWLIEYFRSEDKAIEFIKTGLRGVLNPDGNIRFYTGENWEINKEIEEIFFKKLMELVNKLGIDSETIIEGGNIKGNIGAFWPPRKEYGKVKDFIKK